MFVLTMCPKIGWLFNMLSYKDKDQKHSFYEHLHFSCLTVRRVWTISCDSGTGNRSGVSCVYMDSVHLL